MFDRIVHRLLGAFTDWALSKNRGGFKTEADPRWAYTIGTNGSPYMTRVLLSRLLPLRKWFDIGIYLHHIHRADGDRYLHSHPWKWGASCVLGGSYTEERLEGVIGDRVLTETRHVTRFNFIRDTDYHKILELHGDVWTLFISGPHTEDHQWGFLVDGAHVPEQEFLKKDQ